MNLKNAKEFCQLIEATELLKLPERKLILQELAEFELNPDDEVIEKRIFEVREKLGDLGIIT